MRRKWVLIVFPIILIILIVLIVNYYNGPYKTKQMDELIADTNQIYLQNGKFDYIDDFIKDNLITSSRYIDLFMLETSLRSLYIQNKSDTISADDVTKKLGETYGSGITFTHRSVVGFDFNVQTATYTKNSLSMPTFTTIKFKTVENYDGTTEVYIANIFVTKKTELNNSTGFDSTMLVSNDPLAKDIIYTEHFEGENNLANSLEQSKKIQSDISKYIDKLKIIKYTFKDRKLIAIEYSSNIPE